MPNLTLSQFDQYVQNAPGAFSVDAFTGISGKSIQHIYNGSLFTIRLAVPQTATGVPKGITAGQWSIALKRSVANPTGFFGVTFGQSAQNVSGSGACYTFEIARSGSTSNRIRLTKRAAGGLGSAGTELAQAALTESTDVVTMRIIWDLSTGSFEAFQGTALDYSDLSSIFGYTDASPLSSTVAEGFFISDYNQGASVHTVWFDNLIVATFD